MEISPEVWKAILFTAIALAAGFVVGWALEWVIINRLKKWLKEENLERYRIYRGLGISTGIWLGLWVVLQQKYLNEEWHAFAFSGLKILGILIGMIYLARMLGQFTKDRTYEMARSLPTVSLLQYIVKGAVYVIGFLIILHELNISIAPMLTALGVGGLAVALALQDTLGNLFAGIQIVASRKLKPGQFIILETGQEGFIRDITWRNTTIETYTETTIIIPNRTVANTILTNTMLPDSRVVVRVFGGVHYNSDLEQVEKVLYDVAKEVATTTDGAIAHIEPLVRFYNFGESSVDFRVAIRAKDYDWQFFVAHTLIKAIHKRFKEEGIVIPFPITTLDIDEETMRKFRN